MPETAQRRYANHARKQCKRGRVPPALQKEKTPACDVLAAGVVAGIHMGPTQAFVYQRFAATRNVFVS